MGKDQISVAFLSVVPETDEFTHMGGYSPAGNLACMGLAEALYNSSVGLNVAYGFAPLSIFPRDRRIFFPRRESEIFLGDNFNRCNQATDDKAYQKTKHRNDCGVG